MTKISGCSISPAAPASTSGNRRRTSSRWTKMVGEVTVHVDGNELSLAEFGQLLKYYAGWGMRVNIVPVIASSFKPTPKFNAC